MIRSVEEMIEKYVAAWNKKEAGEFKAAFAECWAEDAMYTDPNYELVKGLEGITELAIGSLKVLPVRTFYIATKPEYHHNVGRYYWKVDLPKETKGGFDYFEFNDEFKITRLVTFL